jgi:hypothetical protein
MRSDNIMNGVNLKGWVSREGDIQESTKAFASSNRNTPANPVMKIRDTDLHINVYKTERPVLIELCLWTLSIVWSLKTKKN